MHGDENLVVNETFVKPQNRLNRSRQTCRRLPVQNQNSIEPNRHRRVLLHTKRYHHRFRLGRRDTRDMCDEFVAMYSYMKCEIYDYMTSL